MSTYKVIQDIEAEDKLLGPLTLRQFIYAAAVAAMGFIAFKLIPLSPLLVLPFLPPMIFFAMLAAPFGHDQPSEVWMLAKIRFFLIPRKRIWNQDGVQELVTITAPKYVEKHMTDGLNQYEVKSRLQALASTLDSRGWAIKNVSVNLFSQPSYLATAGTASDRLLGADDFPQEVPNFEVFATDDIMDERSNPTAQHLDSMISQSGQARRQALVSSIQNNPSPAGGQGAQPPADYWFMNQSAQPTPTPEGYSSFSSNPVVYPGMETSQTAVPVAGTTGEAEQKLLEKVHHNKDLEHKSKGHLKTLQPISGNDSSDSQSSASASQSASTPSPSISDNRDPVASSATPNPAILRLASNDDLNVATIAREAGKAQPKPLDDEVVISFH